MCSYNKLSEALREYFPVVSYEGNFLVSPKLCLPSPVRLLGLSNLSDLILFCISFQRSECIFLFLFYMSIFIYIYMSIYMQLVFKDFTLFLRCIFSFQAF